ncbi:MAG: serine/threonine-protein kinase, partial [Candidatus Xenobia bacterium]
MTLPTVPGDWPSALALRTPLAAGQQTALPYLAEQAARPLMVTAVPLDDLLDILDWDYHPLSRAAGDPNLSRGGPVGTMHYMAPEQVGIGSDIQLNPRSDQYSLGLVLMEILGQRHPLKGHEDLTLTFLMESGGVIGVIRDGVLSMRCACPELVPLAARLTLKEQGARFASMTAVRETLTRLRERLPAYPVRPFATTRVGQVPVLDRLLAWWHAASRPHARVGAAPPPEPAGEGRAITLVGDPGAGKTWLLREFAGAVLTEGEAQIVWADGWAGLQKDLGADPAGMALRLREMAATAPCCVVLENLAEADEAAACRLLHEAKALDAACMVVVAHRRPLSGGAACLTLDPLSVADCEKVMVNLLGAQSVANGFRDRVTEAVGTNPGRITALLEAMQPRRHYVLQEEKIK